MILYPWLIHNKMSDQINFCSFFRWMFFSDFPMYLLDLYHLRWSVFCQVFSSSIRCSFQSWRWERSDSKFAPVEISLFLPQEHHPTNIDFGEVAVSFREGNTFFACFITGSTFDQTRATASDVIGCIESKRWPNQSNGEDVFFWKALFDTMTRPKEAIFCTSPSNPHSWYDTTWVSFTVLN